MRMTSDLLFYKLNSEVKVYLNNNEEVDKRIRKVVKGRVQLNPNERMLVPTGLVFDIPTGYSVRLYPRSSLALKQGLTLANNVGIIDSDYVQPVFMMVCNMSGFQQFVTDGERICQAELVQEKQYVLLEINERPERKTDRDGGFGSTGKG